MCSWIVQIDYIVTSNKEVYHGTQFLPVESDESATSLLRRIQGEIDHVTTDWRLSLYSSGGTVSSTIRLTPRRDFLDRINPKLRLEWTRGLGKVFFAETVSGAGSKAFRLIAEGLEAMAKPWCCR